MCANYVFDTPHQIRIGLLLIFLNGHGGRVSPPELYSKGVADHRSKASFLEKMRQNPHCSVNLGKPG